MGWGSSSSAEGLPSVCTAIVQPSVLQRYRKGKSLSFRIILVKLPYNSGSRMTCYWVLLESGRSLTQDRLPCFLPSSVAPVEGSSPHTGGSFRHDDRCLVTLVLSLLSGSSHVALTLPVFVSIINPSNWEKYLAAVSCIGLACADSCLHGLSQQGGRLAC